MHDSFATVELEGYIIDSGMMETCSGIINPATVTQLIDRGSAQAVGMVTDVGTFVPILAEYLFDER